MDPLITLIVCRSIERILVVLVGWGCIYLGWRLFLIGPESERSEASFGWLKAKVTLKRVGPGVLFAAFGAIVIGASIVNSEHLQTKELQQRTNKFAPSSDAVATPKPDQASGASTDTVSATSADYNGAANINTDNVKRHVAALNKVIELLRTDPNNRDTILARWQDSTSSANVLETIRDNKILAVIGQYKMDLWKQYGEKYKINPRSVPPEYQQILKEISQWFIN